MATYLTDSSDLTSVANAIRTKGGTSGSLAFPAGFVSAVQNIQTGITPTGTKSISITENGTTTEDVTNYASAEITVNVQGGGGYTIDDVCNRAYATQAIDFDLVIPTATRIPPFAFSRGTMKTVSAPNVAYFTQLITNASGNGSFVFESCGRLQSVSFPELVDAGSGGYTFSKCSALKNVHMPKTTFPTYMFDACTSLVNIALGYGRASRAETGTYMFFKCTSLAAVDLSNVSKINANLLRGSSANVLILRDTTLTALGSTGAFDVSAFASNGAGGTLYVPSALVSSYQSATNWSTILGYANNSIQAIEGSQYENYYADGTPIT